MIVRTRFGAVGLDEAGSGEPLLWFHGYPMDRTLWAPQLAQAIPGVRQLAPDLPGFGESERVAVRRIEAWAAWAVELLDTLKVERAIVGGLSMGGYLAFALWRLAPQRVRALILADTRAGADTEEGKAKRREAQQVAQAQGAGPIAERMLTGLVGKSTRSAHPAAVATLDAMMRRQPVDAIVDALQVLMDRPDSSPTLETISVPVLVLCGDEDVITPPAESRAMHEAIRGSRLALLPQAGHASNLEAPGPFNALLSEFVAATIRTGSTTSRTPP